MVNPTPVADRPPLTLPWTPNRATYLEGGMAQHKLGNVVALTLTRTCETCARRGHLNHRAGREVA